MGADMGIDAQLIKENGAVLEQVSDEQNLLVRLLQSMPHPESTHCLQYADPYGDTTFNALQIGRFLDELKQVEAVAESADERFLVREVRRLAALCAGKSHWYLKFVGD